MAAIASLALKKIDGPCLSELDIYLRFLSSSLL